MKPTKITTIKFQNEHLEVIKSALEAYSRAKMGQFGHWLNETFGHKYSYDASEDIEKYIRYRIIESYYEDKYGIYEVRKIKEDYFDSLMSNVTSLNYLRHYYNFLCRIPRTGEEPFPLETNASWGILQSEKVGDGQLAYEIYQTIRQYTAVKQNGGLFDIYTSTRDPLNCSGVSLPEIEGFVTYRDYFFNKTDSKKLHKFCQKKDWAGAFKFIESVKGKYGIKRGDKSQIMWESSHCDVSGLDLPIETSYFLRVDKPRVEDKI